MKKTLYRILATALTVVLTVSLIPVPAYAMEEGDIEVIEEQDIPAEAGNPEEPGMDFGFVPGSVLAPNEDNYESVNNDPSSDQFYGVEDSFYISPVATTIPSRDQGNYGTCWSFATMAAAEMSAVKNQTKLRGGSIADNNIDLSELHLAYFTGKKNEPYNPLGGFEGDINGVRNNNFLNSGGNPEMASFLLTNWIGTADERDYPYSDASPQYDTALQNATDDVMHVRGFCAADPHTDRPAVKKLIKDHGAVTAAFWSYQENNDRGYDFYDVYSSENNCYYVPYEYGTNHVVSIVGWDDDFPKENFAYYEKPEGDGAWLIRNSWEAGNYVEEDGTLKGDNPQWRSYFWMSYYDKSLWRQCYALDTDSVDSFDHNYQYDGCMTSNEIHISDKYANMFTAASDSSQEIEAVYFATYSANVDYKIDIYTGVSEGEPENGTHAGHQEGKTSYAGAHTIELDDPVQLEPGENFSVVITVPTDTKMSVEASWNNGLYVTTAHSEGRRSMCLVGDEWKPVAEIPKTVKFGDLRIKAFTNNKTFGPVAVKGVSLPESRSVSVGAATTLEPTIKPSNAADKSVTWSSSNESIASVNNGVVTGIAAGTADITATTVDGGFTAVCHVTVTDDDDLVMIPGEVRRLKASEDGNYIYGYKWSVESADPKNCISVTNGVVTAKNLPKSTKTGTAVVKAVCGPETLTFNITVDAAAYNNLPIIEGKKKIQIAATKTLTLNADAKGKASISVPAGLRERTGNIEYTIENDAVCSVGGVTYTSNGSKAAFEITAEDVGATYIEWSLADAKGNETKSYTKVVVKKPAGDIRINDYEELKSLTAGQGTWLEVVGTQDNTDSKEPTFSVKGKGIKVSKTGYVVATVPGAKGTVTAKLGKKSASVEVAAGSAENCLVLKQTSVTMTAPKAGGKAKTKTISIGIPSKKADQPKVKWSVDYIEGEKGVSIDEDTGTVTVTDQAIPGVYEIKAVPEELGSSFNEATCELVIK